MRPASNIDLIYHAILVYLEEVEVDKVNKGEPIKPRWMNSRWLFKRAHQSYRPITAAALKAGAVDVLGGLRTAPSERLERVNQRLRDELGTSLEEVQALIKKGRHSRRKPIPASPDIEAAIQYGKIIPVARADHKFLWQTFSREPDLDQPDPKMFFMGEHFKQRNFTPTGEITSVFIRYLNIGVFTSVEVLQGLDTGVVRWVPHASIPQQFDGDIIARLAGVHQQQLDSEGEFPMGIIIKLDADECLAQSLDSQSIIAIFPSRRGPITGPGSLWDCFQRSGVSLNGEEALAPDEMMFASLRYARWKSIDLHDTIWAAMAEMLADHLSKCVGGSVSKFTLVAEFVEHTDGLLQLDLEVDGEWFPPPEEPVRGLLALYVQAVLEYCSYELSGTKAVPIADIDFDLDAGFAEVKPASHVPIPYTFPIG